MRTTGSHAFVNQLLVGLLVAIGLGGSLGMTTVWIRHQITVVADTNRVLEQEIVETERHIADTKALVEEAQSSDILRSENESMRLGLVEMNQAQVLTAPDPVPGLVARANQRVFESREGSTSMRINVSFAPAGAGVSGVPSPRSENGSEYQRGGGTPPIDQTAPSGQSFGLKTSFNLGNLAGQTSRDSAFAKPSAEMKPALTVSGQPRRIQFALSQ